MSFRGVSSCSGWLVRQALFLVVLAVLSQSGVAEPMALTSDAKSYIDTVMSAQSTARSDTLSLLGFLLAAIGLATSITGFSAYKILERTVSLRILNEIRESEARNLIRLGKRSYDIYADECINPEARLASLVAAIAHTDYALSVVDKLNRSDADQVKSDLLALAGTNLGYFYIDMAELLLSMDGSKDVSMYYEKAIHEVERVRLQVEIAQRVRDSEIHEWWNVVESRLTVLFKATNNPCKETFAYEIKCLTDDASVPYAWRKETKILWEKWLDRTI